MADRNRESFYNRLHRIDRIHESGAAFEAAGALGRSYYEANRTPRRKSLWLRPLVLILIGFFALKGGIHAELGTEVYARRVADLAQGSAVERAGAWVMHADTVTRLVSDQIRPFVH
ncbi:MAG: hypothetical protein Q8O82_11635 [Pseudorhodobacter sp.]|nr:hypothetical protein [Pseudorhodobacter sp.]